MSNEMQFEVGDDVHTDAQIHHYKNALTKSLSRTRLHWPVGLLGALFATPVLLLVFRAPDLLASMLLVFQVLMSVAIGLLLMQRHDELTAELLCLEPIGAQDAKDTLRLSQEYIEVDQYRLKVLACRQLLKADLRAMEKYCDQAEHDAQVALERRQEYLLIKKASSPREFHA